MTRHLLVLSAFLAACGPPSATDFSQAATGRAGSAAARAGSGQTAAVERRGPDISTFRGLYYRNGDTSQFQPCGRRRPLDVIGTAEGRALLRERFFWNATWQGRPMYGQFQGAVVVDTLNDRAAGDSVPPDTATRFFITAVDSLRTWAEDCPGMKVR